jgi:hypothetical protein
MIQHVLCDAFGIQNFRGCRVFREPFISGCYGLCVSAKADVGLDNAGDCFGVRRVTGGKVVRVFLECFLTSRKAERY